MNSSRASPPSKRSKSDRTGTRVPTKTGVPQRMSGAVDNLVEAHQTDRSIALRCSICRSEAPRVLAQNFRTSRSEISLCRGTASTAPVAGFVQSECDRPSRFK